MPLAFGITLSASVLKGGAQPLPAVLQQRVAAGARAAGLPRRRGLRPRVQRERPLPVPGAAAEGAPRPRVCCAPCRRSRALDQAQLPRARWGLVLLTLAIVTGIVWAHEAWGRGRLASEPKLLFSVLVWALYAVLLQGRMAAGWRGRRAAQLTIVGLRGHPGVARQRQRARPRRPRRSVLSVEHGSSSSG